MGLNETPSSERVHIGFFLAAAMQENQALSMQ